MSLNALTGFSFLSCTGQMIISEFYVRNRASISKCKRIKLKIYFLLKQECINYFPDFFHVERIKIPPCDPCVNSRVKVSSTESTIVC